MTTKDLRAAVDRIKADPDFARRAYEEPEAVLPIEYELEFSRQSHQDPPPSYWTGLARERGFKVVAMYPASLSADTPDNWSHVGDWTLHRRPVSAFQPTFQFWATTPQEVRPFEAHLRQFQSTKPPGVNLQIDQLAELRANELLS